MHVSNRLATNLEYSGISVNVDNSGNSVQPRGNNRHGSFRSSLQYLVRMVSVILLEFMWNYYYYAAFNAPCVGHEDGESQAQ